MENMFDTPEESNSLETILGKAIEKLVDMLDNVSEFKPHELLTLSILMEDKYVRQMLNRLLPNKKHIKRKHAKEILEAFKSLTQAITPNYGGYNNPELFNNKRLRRS